MELRRTVPTVEAGILHDESNAFGQRVIVYQPRPDRRYALLLIELVGVPGGVSRELRLPLNSVLVFWNRPQHDPTRSVVATVSRSSAYIKATTLNKSLGAPMGDAMLLAELLGYLLGVPSISAGPDEDEDPT